MEDVGKTKTCGIQSVVVCSPDIKTENENSQVEQVQADHNLEDIVSADKDRGNGTEEEHQGVSDEEGHNRGDGTRFSVLCKTCEVRGCGSAGNEGADDKTGTADDSQRSAGFGKLIDDRSVASHYGHDHGDRSENGNTWYSDIADDGQRFDTKIGRGGHADAGKKNKSPLCRSASAEQLLGNRNCKHGKTDTKPSDLRKAGHG